MKKDNKGTSIIELVVILTIMAIVVGFLLNTVGYLRGKQAKECAYQLDMALASIRMETMSKSTGADDVYLELYLEDKQIKANCYVKGEETIKTLGKKVEVTATDTGGTTVAIDGSNRIRFYFNRATGALRAAAAPNDKLYKTITITQGDVTYEVTIEPVTGKFSYERVLN